MDMVDGPVKAHDLRSSLFADRRGFVVLADVFRNVFVVLCLDACENTYAALFLKRSLLLLRLDKRAPR